MDFTTFGFHPNLMEGIEASGYITPTPIQSQVIPAILEGRDVIASAQTGTGKTAAFLLPMVDRILKNHVDGQVNALIVVPTRELAIQISQHLEGLSYFTHLSSLPIYGGNDAQSFVTEKKALQMGADVIVCTPGRMIAHMNMGYVNMKNLQFLVLDEADRMLDMGFQEDISRIIRALGEHRQTLLFSATMPDKIRQLAKRILKDPLEVNIALAKPPEKIIQKAFLVYEAQKLPLVKHLVTHTPFKNALIFCSRKHSVKQLTRELKHEGIKVGEIHSDLEQSERENILSAFAGGRIPLLVATDILSRGIDIDTIDVVINYDVPRDAEDYVHRIGRTARAEADGMAFTIVEQKEQGSFASIERLIGKEIMKEGPPPSLGPGPAYDPRRRHGKAGGGRGGKRPSFQRKRR